MGEAIQRRPDGPGDPPDGSVEAAAPAVADAVLAVASSIRYVAVSVAGVLVTRVAAGRAQASGEESDWYEERLVNPTILDLTSRRGEIGCGGLDYVVVRYGHFFQLLVPATAGHVSACVEPDANPVELAPAVFSASGAVGSVMRQPAAREPGSALAREPFVWGDRPAAATRRLLGALYAVSDEVRYVALRGHGRLLLSSRVGDPATETDRSDRYEELLVNPTLLAIAGARGAIDCGGLRFLAIAYGAFFALVLPTTGGHATISLPRSADPVVRAPAFEAVLARQASVPRSGGRHVGRRS